jgi:hypothetical protein
LLALFRRQAVKTIQLILQMLLLLWWKAPELRIALQRFPLLLRGQILMLAQPLSSMSGLLSFRRTRYGVGCVFVSLRQTRNRAA